MKRLRIGRRRRAQVSPSSPLDGALAPALHDGRWQVPDRFNFTRDVVEPVAASSKRQALRCIRRDGIIEPRTFSALAGGSAHWASFLREQEVQPGDTVTVLLGASAPFAEVVLGCLKIGAVAVPVSPEITPAALEAQLAVTGSSVVVTSPSSTDAIAQLSFSPDVYYLEEETHVPKRGPEIDEAPTANTSAQDVALLLWTSGTETSPKPVAHTHAATFATRVQAEHWLGADAGDVVWCVGESGSALTALLTLFGPWARGAEVILQEVELEPREHLELAYRLGTTILCQTPADYRSLAGVRDLARFRPPGLRRLVSTGDVLDPDLVRVFEEAWGTTILDGYGQTETNVIVARDELSPEGSLGRPLPGHHVAVIDDQGNALPAGFEGDLALRGRPPTLFTGYWELPEETKSSFRGDWYVTGDCARMDDEDTIWFVGRSEDVITGRNGTFGPAAVERTLRAHESVSASAVIGVRDLERGGQFLRAFVVLDPRAEGTEQLQAELRHFVGESLPEQQVPREIEFVAELPISRSGAVSRSTLRGRPVARRPLWESTPTSEPEPDAVTALAPPVPAPEAETPVVDVELPSAIEPEPEPAYFAYVTPETPEISVSEIPVSEIPAREIDPPVGPAEVVPEPVPELASADHAFEPVALVPSEAPLLDPFSPAYEPGPRADEGLPLVTDEVAQQSPANEPEIEEAAWEPEPAGEAVVEPATELSAETAPLEAAAEQAPFSIEPEPVPQPSAAEPLPDFVVDPAQTPEYAAPPPPPPATPPEPEPEPEPELGPLPEYVIDPSRRLRPVADLDEPAREPERAPEPVSPAAAARLQFPSAGLAYQGLSPVAPPDPNEGAEHEQESRSRPRNAPAPADRRKWGRSSSEPGDDVEGEWMSSLSSKLSAYGLTSTQDDDAPAATDEAEQEPDEPA